MDDAQQQLIERLKTANNVLVTVSRNPSVDQLASCIGLSLLLNKQGKHSAAVFSGKVPSTIEFLQPEETLEKNTDSLRDFIIALDKSKADKLRYKVEDNVVRIFITPYKTSISQDDLEFTEGDFNVDVVVALGVRQQEDLDEAIVAHGRILHDATVTSINTAPDGGLGSINWYDPQASSLSELVTELAEALAPDLLDTQIATALLTGIVSETDRFSNDKTSSETMSISAALMAAGANQQLVASKLAEKPEAVPVDQAGADGTDGEGPADASSEDGTLQIDHSSQPPEETPDSKTDAKQEPPSALPELASTNDTEINPGPPESDIQPSNLSSGSRMVTEPPSMGGTLTANSQQEGLDPTTDPLSLPDSEPPQLLNRKQGTFDTSAPSSLPPPPTPEPPLSSLPTPVTPPTPTLTPPPAAWTPPPDPPLPSIAPPPSASSSTSLSSSPLPSPSPSLTPSTPPPPGPSGSGDQTLTDLEKSLGDPHAKEERVDTARDEVNRALLTDDSGASDEPIQALNAQPMGGSLHADDAAADLTPEPKTSQVTDPTAPPPVPPPIPFQFGSP
jgi:hypothetical protein